MSIPLRHVAFDAQLALLENSISRYTRNLVRYLRESRPDLRISLLVFSHRNSEEIRREQDWIPDDAQLVVLKGRETPHHLSTFERFWRRFIATPLALRKIGAQIYHGHYTDFPVPMGFKVVTTVHDVFQWQPELGRMKSRLSGLRKWLDRLIYRQAHLVCASDSTKSDFCRFLDPGHPSIRRIYAGNDPIFRPLPEDGDPAVLARYGLNSKRYFLYVGDLTPRKDVGTLIRAFHQALPTLPEDFRLALSKGHWTVCPERDLVESLHLSNRVTFLGHIEEAALPSLYRNAYAFVFPSLYEGFGFPPIEAMACGTPVISTNYSALSEIVGPAGLTFPRKDSVRLGQLMHEIINNSGLHQDCIQRGLAHSSQFTWQTAAKEFLKTYEKAVSPGSTP